jgi:hypothetical protein
MAKRLVLLSFLAATLIGCHSATDSATAPSAPAPVGHASATPSDAPTAATPTSPAQTAEHNNNPPQVVAKEFSPPFQDRTDMFEPPHKSAGVAHREAEQGATVELKGFVNVDGQQVVLAIDGVISPIPEGGEKYGVQVISINPPSVVLQRGRSRWTASLD